MGADFLLSLRQGDGHDLRHSVLEESPPERDKCSVIFIHGFHVSRSDALRQWQTFRSLLQLTGETQCGVLLWPSGRGRLSYPAQADKAEAAGNIFGDYLSAHPRTKYVLIGHSLGALVALQAANRFRFSGHQLIEGFALLGAAVRSSKLSLPGGTYSPRHANHEAIAYSPVDWTLRMAFRPGTWLSAPFSAVGDAVGLRGEPTERDWIAHNFRVRNHSYWKMPRSAQLVRLVLGGRAPRQVAEQAPPPEWDVPVRPPM